MFVAVCFCCALAEGTSQAGVAKAALTAACIDKDNDTYGENCTLGPDCNDNNSSIYGPVTYYRDLDRDGYGDAANATAACSAPEGYVTDNTDCNDDDIYINPGIEEICDDYIDNDCDNQTDFADPDCADICIDHDNDGYYVGGDNCTPRDCDDTDEFWQGECVDCSMNVIPKKISKLRALLQPIEPFVIYSDVEFAQPITIDWETEAINDIIRVKIGKGFIIGFLLVRPFKLEAGEFTVVVPMKFRASDTIPCFGTITVK
jgi:hypothetical protein